MSSYKYSKELLLNTKSPPNLRLDSNKIELENLIKLWQFCWMWSRPRTESDSVSVKFIILYLFHRLCRLSMQIVGLIGVPYLYWVLVLSCDPWVLRLDCREFWVLKLDILIIWFVSIQNSIKSNDCISDIK